MIKLKEFQKSSRSHRDSLVCFNQARDDDEKFIWKMEDWLNSCLILLSVIGDVIIEFRK